MTRIEDRRRAIEFRRHGETYSDIRKKLKIAKSTLSDWLSKYPLTKEQLRLLAERREEKKKIAIEKYRMTRREKREKRLKDVYDKEQRYWNKLNKRELKLAGIFLYWGEGNKRMNGPLALNNTDPYVLKFALYWISNSLKVPKNKIKIDLHLYGDMNIQKEMKYWSSELNMPLAQFRKPYIKQSKRVDIDQKGFGHGTCGLVVSNIRLKEKIMMGIKAIADYYSAKI